MNDKFNEIIGYFGVRNQLKKFNEESYELIEAIRDYEESYLVNNVRMIEQDFNHIIEELADCYVLLNQLQCYYKIDDEELSDIINSKLDRTIKRMNEGYYDKK